MKYESGNWLFHVYKWHSVNLVPHATLGAVCDDESLEVIQGNLWLTIFGLVFVLGWPGKKARGHTILKPRGPAWSRKRQTWYTIGKTFPAYR